MASLVVSCKKDSRPNYQFFPNMYESSSASLFVYENLDGNGNQWQEHTVYQGDEHHDGAQVVDIDGDGDLDIISIGWGHNDVLWYENLQTCGSQLKSK